MNMIFKKGFDFQVKQAGIGGAFLSGFAKSLGREFKKAKHIAAKDFRGGFKRGFKKGVAIPTALRKGLKGGRAGWAKGWAAGMRKKPRRRRARSGMAKWVRVRT